MEKRNLVETLRCNSGFWSQLGWCHFPPRKDWDGKQILFLRNPQEAQKFHSDMYWSGIRIHTSFLFSGWTGDGEYDYETTDATLDQIFSCCGDDMLYMPRIPLDPPLDWCRKHPEELVAYYPGIDDPAEIAKLVDSPRHDLLGYEALRGKYTWGKWVDFRPNVGGLIGVQSFSSKKWLADAGVALKRLIRRLETSKYGKRIIGYHLAYGMCGETHMFRSWSGGDKYADYGIGNRKEFFKWGLAKYGSVEKLAEKWNQPGLSEASFEMPSPAMRNLQWSAMEDFLRTKPSETICSDLERFTTSMNCNAIESFGKDAKDASDGKPVGFFYGYLNSIAAYTGHLGIGRLLESPYVDFLACPKAYHHLAGEPGGVVAPAMSISRKKLFLCEEDETTHMCHTPDRGPSGGDSMTMDDTRTVLWREFARNLMQNSGFYWMDLGGHFFDDFRIHAETGRIEEIKRRLCQCAAEPLSEVLTVIDEESFYCFKNSAELEADFNKRSPQRAATIPEIALCGAPVDAYRFDDLKELDLTRYKCVFFLNQYKLEKSAWALLKTRFKPGTVFSWLYAPGVFAPDYDPKNSLELCGMLPAPYPKIFKQGESASFACEGLFEGLPRLEKKFFSGSYPFFSIVPAPGVEALGRLEDGALLAGKAELDGFSHIYLPLPCLRHQHFRRIMEFAKVRFFAPQGVAVYADSRFVSFFPREAVDFDFKPPRPSEAYDPVTGERFDYAESFRLKLKAKDARFIVLGSGTWASGKPKINQENILFPN